jgi:nucleoside-triphosphatase THEP1
MEEHSEPRIDERLVVTINGRDGSGHPFTQDAVASRLSESGALLSGITKQVRAGDLLWVEHQGKRSRFKVVWVRDSESHHLIQAAIHRVKAESCPWGESANW